jgi:hypothetical protein
MKPRRARAIRPGQRRRVAPGSGRLAKRREEPTLCRGRASRASDLVCSSFLHLKRVLSNAWAHLQCVMRGRLACRPALSPIAWALSACPVGITWQGDRLAGAGEEGGGSIGIGSGWPRSVLLLQASERRELAPASGVGLEHTEDVDHLGGAKSAFDRLLDVREGEGRAAEMRSAQGLF